MWQPCSSQLSLSVLSLSKAIDCENNRFFVCYLFELTLTQLLKQDLIDTNNKKTNFSLNVKNCIDINKCSKHYFKKYLSMINS